MKYIKLFEAVIKQTPNDILKEYDMTTKELDRIIDVLTKYNLDAVLLRELKGTQERAYRDLRKWKVESFMKRFELVRPRVEELMEVQDYFLELSDMGYGIMVSASNKTIRIRIGGNKKRDLLSSLAEVTSFLKQLNTHNRLPVKLTDFGSMAGEDDDEDADLFVPVRYTHKKIDHFVQVSYDSPTLVDRWY